MRSFRLTASWRCIIQSWAAHNEYLRMLVEGGQLGRGLLIALFVLWVVQHTRRLCRTDKVIMRLVFLASRRTPIPTTC